MLKYFINLGKISTKASKSLKIALSITKPFARREITKGQIHAQNIITQSQNVKKAVHLDNTIPKLTTLEESLSIIKKNILEVNDKQVSHFQSTVINFFKNEGLLRNQNFLNALQEIASNYSQNNDNFQNSTLFKFICLIDQIFNRRSLDFYEKEKVTHIVFPHLIESFTTNFSSLFEKNSEFLLNYNYLYFMFINKGEFSNCLQIVFDQLKNKEDHLIQINKLLNTKIFIRNNSESLESILNNKEIFNLIETNTTTPSSDFIEDYSFKYNDKLTKQRLIKDSIQEKKVYEKMKWVYNSLKSIQNFNIQLNPSTFKVIETFLATNFVENSEKVFTKDYVKIREELRNQNIYLESKLNSLTKLKKSSLTVEIGFDNIYDVYNPLFSGETKLENQFAKVASKFDNGFALELLKKYIEVNSEAQETNFDDLFRMKTNLLNKDNFNKIIKQVGLTHYTMDTFEQIEFILKSKKEETTKVSPQQPKEKVKQTVADKSEKTQTKANKPFVIPAAGKSNSFVNTTKKGYSNVNKTDEPKKFTFIVPPKDTKPQVEKKPAFVIPEKSEKFEKIVHNNKIKEERKIEVTENLPKFIVPPKETKETEREFKKMVIPQVTKSQKVVKITKPESLAFQPIELKKKIENLRTLEPPKSEGTKILEKLEEISKSIQHSLYYTYSETNNEGIDIDRARERYSAEYWQRKMYNEEFDNEMEANEIEKHFLKRLLKVFKKYQGDREKTLMVIYSLTNPILKSEFLIDLEYSFYILFSDPNNNSIFSKTNLGHIGYQTLLSNCLLDSSLENRKNFESIINHIESNSYLPNNDNIQTIIEICNRNYYPKYLKVILDNYVLNKNIKLSTENYVKYVQIVSNFDELSTYVSNLIETSFSDFLIPIKAEFYEQILLNYMHQSNAIKIQESLSYLEKRYLIDYSELSERIEESKKGYKVILDVFVEFFESTKDSKKSEILLSKKDITNEASKVISKIKEFNLKWKDDLEFIRASMKIYIAGEDGFLNDYLNHLEILLNQQKVNKSDFLDFVKVVSNSRQNLDSKSKITNILNIFIESYLKTEIFYLTYTEKFSIIREENLNRFLRLFSNYSATSITELHSGDQLAKNFLVTLVDSSTYDKLPKLDKINFEKIMMKLHSTNKREAGEVLDIIDIKR